MVVTFVEFEPVTAVDNSGRVREPEPEPLESPAWMLL